MKLTEHIALISNRIRLAGRVSALTGGTYQVDSAVITNGGSLYSTATITPSGGGGSGAALTATILNGVILSATVTNNGTGYTSTPTLGISGDGSGAAATAIMLPETLDAIPTVGLSLTPALAVEFLLNGKLQRYLLQSGTDAENSPYVIRPDDYASSTNEKVWKPVESQSQRVVCFQKTLTYGASTALDFSAPEFQDLSLSGDVTITTSNKASGRIIRLRIIAPTTGRNFTFPSWKWMSSIPASIAADKYALLTLHCFGTSESDVLANYAVEA